MVLQILMGEGFLREKNPSPIIARGNTELPSPAGGEGTTGDSVPPAELRLIRRDPDC